MSVVSSGTAKITSIAEVSVHMVSHPLENLVWDHPHEDGMFHSSKRVKVSMGKNFSKCLLVSHFLMSH